MNSLALAGIIISAIVIILALKFILRWIEVKREWQMERARLQGIQVQAAAGAPITQPAANGSPSPPYAIANHVVEMGAVNRFLDDILREKPARFTPENLREFTRNYAERLGSGGFGVVYRGAFPNGVQVAVKILNSTLDRRAEEQFMAEVGTAGRTYHINLVRLYGFCFDATAKALVYEYLEKSSLDRVLFEHEQRQDTDDLGDALGFETLYGIVVGTARGVRYLHEECQHRIIHYDIKPGNVLLTADYTPKVADFGLARLCNRDNTHLTMTGARGTPGYAAPELWLPLPVTHKCDVYSFVRDPRETAQPGAAAPRREPGVVPQVGVAAVRPGKVRRRHGGVGDPCQGQGEGGEDVQGGAVVRAVPAGGEAVHEQRGQDAGRRGGDCAARESIRVHGEPAHDVQLEQWRRR
ncbi:hypothetical protein BDA96_06G270000 [Sorghum bicolor]|uniref:non-specific serine/threonine protein kinase n=1 Tax=Sorghum bicolor TaxID=4558 RepID=A0A921QU24_SORBI|nr:hypothetical protein BDA96_06G270000 [Sorghum bicolor]